MKRKAIVAVILLLSPFLFNAQTSISSPQFTPNSTDNINEDSNQVESEQNDTIKTKSTLDSLFTDVHTILTIQEHRMEIAKERLDNIDKEEVISDTEALYSIKDNTEPNFWANGWNLIALIALITSIISAFYTIVTFRAQSKTEKHTKNAPLSAQIGRFKDLTRHLYRNLVCTSSAIAKFNSASNLVSVPTVFSATKKQTGKQKTQEEESKEMEVSMERIAFPSESNFNKLKTMPDDVILNIDVNERTYTQLHELKVLMRNYNIEIDIASSHTSNKQIWDKAIKQDFDNLIFKPLHLIKSAFESEELMLCTESGKFPLPDRSVYIILEEHFKKLESNFKTLGFTDSFDILKSFFAKPAEMTLTDVSDIDLVKMNYISMVDVTKALNRALNGFIKEASRYNSKLLSALPDSNGYTLKVNKKIFCDYLDDREDQIEKQIQANLCENKKLLKAAKWRLLWPFNQERKNEEIKLIEAAISKLNKENEDKKDPQKKISYFVNQIAKSEQLETFIMSNFVQYDDINDPSHVSLNTLHQQLLTYINYISKEEWDFRELLYLVLAIDSSIEVGRIGMVNYAK